MTIRAPKGKRPYSGSRVPVDRSKEQIGRLLREYGAEGVSWSDNFATGEVQLRFAVRGGDNHIVGFRITPAAFMERHITWDPVKGKQVINEVPDWSRSMRLLHAWIKTKLESIAFGLTAVEEEFLAQRVVYDGQGRETTVGDLVIPSIGSGSRLALTSPSRPVESVDTQEG